jgi:hypothetical protein
MPHVLGHVDESQNEYKEPVGLLFPAYIPESGKVPTLAKNEIEKPIAMSNPGGAKKIVRADFAIIFIRTNNEMLFHGQTVRFHPLFFNGKSKPVLIATNVVPYEVHDDADTVEKEINNGTFKELPAGKLKKIHGVWQDDLEYRNGRSYREIYGKNQIIGDQKGDDEKMYKWITTQTESCLEMNILRKPESEILEKIKSKLGPLYESLLPILH